MVELKNTSFGSIGASSVEQQEEKLFDLKSLIETGIVKREIKIDDKIFILKSLSMSERKELAIIARKILQQSEGQSSINPEEAMELNNVTLTFAIYSVNDVPIENLHPNQKLPVLQRKREIIDQMQFHVLAELISFYNEEILLPSEQQIEPGEVKN